MEEEVSTGDGDFLQEVRMNIPVPVRWKDGKHIASRLLTPEENSKVFEVLGDRRRSLATTVAQMWFAAPRRSPVWTDKQFGVLCLVKDFTKKSHFIRLVDIIGDKGIVQEQEVRRPFRYEKILNTFHTFEACHCIVGLNFCDPEEASFFHHAISKTTASFKRKNADDETIPRESKVERKIRECDLSAKNVHSSFNPNDDPTDKQKRIAGSAGKANDGLSYKGGLKESSKLPPQSKSVVDNALRCVNATLASTLGLNVRPQPERSDKLVLLRGQQAVSQPEMIQSLASSKSAKKRSTADQKMRMNGLRKNALDPSFIFETAWEKVPFFYKDPDLITDIHRYKAAAKRYIPHDIDAISSNLRSQIRESARSNGQPLRKQAILANSNLHAQPNDVSELSDNFMRSKPLRRSARSIDIPINLTTKNSCAGNDRSDSSCSFPSLPSQDMLMFPSSVHESGSHDGSKQTRRNSQQSSTPSKAILPRRISPLPLDVKSSRIDSSAKGNSQNHSNVHEELMKAILAGKKLRKVNTRYKDIRRYSKVVHEDSKVMTDVLSKALDVRNKALQDSSDEENSGDEDEEWHEDAGKEAVK